MKTKHTIGEWEINHWTRRTDNGGGVYCEGKINGIWHFSAPLVDEDYYQIVSPINPMKHCLQADHQGAHICRIIDFKQQDGGEEALANANLIASSPDLLKCLLMMDECLRGGVPIVKDDPIHNVIKSLIQKANP
jgi:hypothetical protein